MAPTAAKKLAQPRSPNPSIFSLSQSNTAASSPTIRSADRSDGGDLAKTESGLGKLNSGGDGGSVGELLLMKRRGLKVRVHAEVVNVTPV